MLRDVKEKLITNTDALIELLEEFGFEKITARVTELRFARDNEGGANNIQIRLDNNDGVYVRDYARNINTDIISYIMQEKNVDFKTVLGAIKKILNLSDTWQEQKRVGLFGGVYDTVKKKAETIIKTYPESTMDKYVKIGARRWIEDGIDLSVQEEFGIEYDVESQRIVFPIRNEFGQIIAVKGRRNYETDEEGDPKYLFLEMGPMSQTLYGYTENYGSLYNSDVLVVEAEKSVLQAASFGYRNVVALGSCSLSEKQTQLLLQLNPKRIIMALDEGMDFEHIKRNLDLIESFAAFSGVKLLYWDTTKDETLKDTKNSPCDLGKDKFNEIMREQLVEYNRGNNE